MPVFISHRKADTAEALRAGARLKMHRITTYLDVLDPRIQSAENVTQQILAGLQPCTHLLAIISTETAGSWWVPFEIGVATNADKRITSFCISIVSPMTLPDYLRVWPILTRENQLDLFARRYLEDKTFLEKSYRLSEARTTLIQTANDFHRFLKQDLQQ